MRGLDVYSYEMGSRPYIQWCWDVVIYAVIDVIDPTFSLIPLFVWD